MSQTPPQPETRDRWDSRTAFIMAAVGSAVGLGNVWRFPGKVYEGGGGAFFIPYIIALITAGIPLMILEYGIGQLFQGSAPKALARVNKNYEWVGWFSLCVGGVISFFYAVVMAWALVFLVDSVWCAFSGVVPWGDAPAVYFKEYVLAASRVPGERWDLHWPLVACLAAIWIAVFLIIYKGVRRVGRVVLVTVPLPVILLGILALRGLGLDGAIAGVEYYLNPDFSKLGDPDVWISAYGQIFFSLSLGFGILIAYASYNKRRGDVTNNAFITSLANCATSFLAGFVVFSVLGFLAFKEGCPVEDVTVDTGGGGLAFITYPTAIAKLGEYGAFWPPLVAILFFLMLLSLGIDSLFSIVEGVVAGLHDRFRFLTRGRVTAIMCGGGFLTGLLFATRAGGDWVDQFNAWADYGLVFVGLMECLVVGYFFRTARLEHYINEVSEIHLGGWWKLCIRLIVPLTLVVILAAALLEKIEEQPASKPPPAQAASAESAPGAVKATRAEEAPTGQQEDDETKAWLEFAGYVSVAVFFGLFVMSFLLGRRWGLLCIVGLGLVSYCLFRIWLTRPASLAGALALMILLGGLGVCVAIAVRGKDVEHHERTHGWPEREKRPHLAPDDADDE